MNMEIYTKIKEYLKLNNFKYKAGYWFIGTSKKSVDMMKIQQLLPSDLTDEVNNKQFREIFEKLNEEAKIEEEEKALKRENKYNSDELIRQFKDILEEENIILDIANMEYKVIIAGIEKDITRGDLTNLISSNQNMRIINTGEGIDSRMLVSFIDVSMFKIRKQKEEDLINSIKFNKEDEAFVDEYLEKWHEALMIAQDIEIFKTLMKHFIWQIKRRIISQPTYNDIMISIYGNQGIGKSFLTNGIFKPVLNVFYNSSINLSNLQDERWIPVLQNQYLMNIEEIDTGSESNYKNGQSMASIKKIITGTEATYRPMATNKPVSVKINTSFISNANYHIYKVMNDESGMRRFFEFVSQIKEHCRIDEDKVKFLCDNSMRLFCGINEELSKGYWDINSEVGKKISEIQMSYVNKPTISLFKEKLIFNPKLKNKDCIKLNDLYDIYTEFNKEMGDSKCILKKNFKRAIEDLFPGCSKIYHKCVIFSLELVPEEVEEIKPLNYSSFKRGKVIIENSEVEMEDF